MIKGKFITFEGCEGVGKSTQIRMLKEYLKTTNQEAIFIREPGGNSISEKIRELILDPANSSMTSMCEAMLYSSARSQLIEQVIAPALDNGTTVICDRFIDSTIAYQGYARGLGVQKIKLMNELVCGDYMPDLTIFLDLPPSDSFKRKGGHDKSDRMELESIEFHNDVYSGYIEATKLYPTRIVRISPRGSKSDTASAIIKTLQARGLIQ